LLYNSLHKREKYTTTTSLGLETTQNFYNIVHGFIRYGCLVLPQFFFLKKTVCTEQNRCLQSIKRSNWLDGVALCVFLYHVFPPLSTNPRFMHVLLQSNPTETAARQIDIRQTPCLKLTGRRSWRYPENARISRGRQLRARSRSFLVQPSTAAPCVRPRHQSTGASASGEGRGAEAVTDGRAAGTEAAPPPSTRHPVSHRTCPPRPPRVSRVTHTARATSQTVRELAPITCPRGP